MSLIEKIKAEVSILEAVKQYSPIDLSRVNTGRASFKVSCCFHADGKKPNLNINNARNTFKCFSCGVGGDVINFTALVNGIGIEQALSLLAKDFAIKTVAPFQDRATRTAEKHRKQQEKEHFDFLYTTLVQIEKVLINEQERFINKEILTDKDWQKYKTVLDLLPKVSYLLDLCLESSQSTESLNNMIERTVSKWQSQTLSLCTTH